MEDDRQLADATLRGLRSHNFAVDLAFDGQAALDKTAVTEYEVVVLDRDLPLVHGDEVCRRLAGGRTRILMLTALGKVEDRVDGPNLGADDYLPKPFALSELVARLRALGRRSESAVGPTLTVGDISLEPHVHRVTRAGNEIDLTPKEFAVLQELMSSHPSPVSAEQLLERVWDENADPFSNVVRVVMVTLRRKLGTPPPIETIKSVGYRLLDT